MATVIRMPAVLANAEEGVLQSWLVSVGDKVSIGQPLAEVETEKATVEYNAEVEGTLLRVLVEPGKTVDVGTPIAVVGAPGDSDSEVDGLLGSSAATPSSAPEPASAAHPTRHFMSPLVRRLAKERGLDLSGVTGTGPDGRIVRRDIENLPAEAELGGQKADKDVAPHATQTSTSAQSTSAEFLEIPHTGMRRAIARRLTESKTTVPHFYLTAQCRVDQLLKLRRQINETSPIKISVNDFVVKAVASAFIDVPDANVTWSDSAMRKYSSVDVSVAVATEGGLLTPVLRGVDKLTLSGVSSMITELAQRARGGKLRQNELEGGSFSVTNLGMYGTDEFSAIINPPQSGILAVGAATRQPVVEDGELAVGYVMRCTLSADHRAIDGALAAQWLAAFSARIENPLSILI